MHQHVADSELVRYLSDAESVSPQQRAEIESAIADCAQCRTSADFLAVLATEDWTSVDASESAVEWNGLLREYAELLAAEDRAADQYIAEMELFAKPGKTAWTNLSRNKRLLTGGVARRLSTHAHEICETNPLEALTFADAAISIAEALPNDEYPFSAVYDLRGAAWKERANALLVKGDYPEALQSLVQAERAYRHLQSPGFGLATVALVRASVLCAQGELSAASTSAELAEHGFAHLGQDERRMRAIFLRADIKLEAGELPGALELFQLALEYGESVDDGRWIARASQAIATCTFDLGRVAEASMHFHRALVIFREIGPAWDRMSTEWGLARIVLQGGNFREAARRLNEVALEYEDHGMLIEAALVRLDVVEAWLALGETKQIADLTSRLFRAFKAAGMIRSALTAIGYMKEVAAAGTLTHARLEAVRAFLRQSSRRPQTAFLPPSDTFD